MSGLLMSQELLSSLSTIFGETDNSVGFSKSELEKKLVACGIACVDDDYHNNGLVYKIGLNKKDWFYNCLVAEWNKTKSTTKFVQLLETIFNPINFVKDEVRLRNMLKSVNDILIFAGAQVNDKGKVAYIAKKETINGVEEQKKEMSKKEEEKRIDFEKLKCQLIELSKFAPQERGYAFEKFLTNLFSEFSLKPREPFRIVGEQIDGSFDYNGEFYLVEARWRQDKITASDIAVFNAKITNKSSFTRGAFFSYSVFDDYIFQTYNNRGSSFILITVNELYEMLDAKMKLQDFIYKKVRALAEEGVTNKKVVNS